MTAPPKPILVSLDADQIEHAKAMLDRFVDTSSGAYACWPWTGGSLVRGYGVFYSRGTAKTRRMVKAHRLAYELANGGQSPAVVDHLCHDNDLCKLGELCPHRRCCNPAHLGAESVAGNVSRALKGIWADECGAGHRMSGENVYEAPDGSRRCRRCAADRARERRAAAERRTRSPLHSPRPRDVPAIELVAWALDGQDTCRCMTWPGIKPTPGGYAEIRFKESMVPAHRLVYEVKHGSIPAGYVVDHVCHDPKVCPGGLECVHRACVNPDHLNAVPAAINTAAARSVRYRPEACQAGHPFSEENTYVSKRGTRHCIACRNERQRRRREEAQEASGWSDKRFREGNVCPNGHDVTVTGLTSIGKCAQCTRESSQRAKTRARERRSGAPLPKRTVIPGAMCVNGHDKSVVGVTASYGCRECFNERRRAARAVKSAERKSRRGTVCRKGLHDKAVTGVTSAGSCAECRREGELRRGSGEVGDGEGSGRRRQGNACRNGHDVTVVGLAKDGTCAECRREISRRHAARKAAEAA